ncbi:MAG: GNAT family N-acetyltransferase [Chlorobi bacterium]|nr:GNAT family N-acetyltransferase [Chlorobiota bacterium]
MKALENSVIRLRSLEPDDLNFLYQTENTVELWEVSNSLLPFSKYILQKYIENSHLDIFTTKQVRLIIETRKEKETVGLIELFDYEPIHLRAGIGIHIVKNEQRKNYAEQTIRLIIMYCKNILRLNQIYCNISFDNTASIKLFEKIGFEHTGTKKQWLNTGEGFKDVFFYQLLL